MKSFSLFPMVGIGFPNIVQYFQGVVFHRDIYIPFWYTGTFQFSRVFLLPSGGGETSRGRKERLAHGHSANSYFYCNSQHSNNFLIYYHNDSGRYWKLALQISPTHDKTKLELSKRGEGKVRISWELEVWFEASFSM